MFQSGSFTNQVQQRPYILAHSAASDFSQVVIKHKHCERNWCAHGCSTKPIADNYDIRKEREKNSSLVILSLT